jgi:hypothetical protein
MTASVVGYANVLAWVKMRLVGGHDTVVRTVAWVVLCILVAQRVTPAALARAIPAEDPGSGRSRLRRVSRWWQGPELDLGTLTPLLVRAALYLLPKAEGQLVVVAMDTSRAGQWEIWQAGLCFAGHTLPVAWAVVPYPWPKGRFRETTLGLIEKLQAALPKGLRWSLVADRGFPSALLFGRLHDKQSDYTLRLRLCDWVEVAGVYAMVSAHLEAGRLKPGERVEATIGTGRPDQPKTTAWLVVNEVIPEPPPHKRNPGTLRERARRAKAQARHLANKGRKSRPRSERAKRYEHTWVLFTTAETVSEAVRQYALRMTIEETFRDWHHGWGLRDAVIGLSTEAEVCRLVGLVCLAYNLQVELGWRLSQSTLGRWRRAQWTVTNRVSLFWCGQQLFLDQGYDWRDWLKAQWAQLSVPASAPVTSPEPIAPAQLAA